jgi:hypothetical protein
MLPALSPVVLMIRRIHIGAGAPGLLAFEHAGTLAGAGTVRRTNQHSAPFPLSARFFRT